MTLRTPDLEAAVDAILSRAGERVVCFDASRKTSRKSYGKAVNRRWNQDTVKLKVENPAARAACLS